MSPRRELSPPRELSARVRGTKRAASTASCRIVLLSYVYPVLDGSVFHRGQSRTCLQVGSGTAKLTGTGTRSMT